MKNRIDLAVAMTPTEESISTFKCHMPDSWIYRRFEQDKLEDMIRVQRKTLKTNKEKAKSLGLYMDDCMYDKKCLKTTAMRELFMNGRHMKVTFICAVQYIMDIGPDLRSQIDYVFALRENIISNRMKLWKYFFGVFPSFADFAAVLHRCTENYSALVLDNTKSTSDLSECLY